MAYSERIKSFDRIHDYMRDFYVYGFRHRGEHHAKSARSYDNERRRIESWLGEYMMFEQDAEGKCVFISIDSRAIVHNPLYKAFKAKSFTARDVILHFFLLDILMEGESRSVSKLCDILENEYFSVFDTPPLLDESTVRNKLREYAGLGLLETEKQGKTLLYRLSHDEVELNEWSDAISFYSEAAPQGVIGSYLLDKLKDTPACFRFKHHYILHALESEVMADLLAAIGDKRRVELDIFGKRRSRVSRPTVTPLKIYISTQGGRQYLLARGSKLHMYRLDSIRHVRILEADKECSAQAEGAEQIPMWGASLGNLRNLERIEINIYASEDEAHIINRLEREKRCGQIEELGNRLYCFSADVYDAMELMPWLRTFIGRIVALECSNPKVKEVFLADLRKMTEMYIGGDVDALS